jgi:uncharacterized protein (TIGR02217 family)
MDDDDGAGRRHRVQAAMTSAVENFDQALAQVLAETGTPAIRATQLSMQVVALTPAAVRRFTQSIADMIATNPAPIRRIAQCYVQLLCTRSPNYEFIPMVLPDVFPHDISYNSVGSTRFATDVIVVDSGDDQRVGRWSQPLMEYDIAYGVRTMEQLMALIGFFRAMRGRLYAFCYQDNVDHSSSVPVAYEARTAPPITPTDQFIATGDGVTYQFQLIKTYATFSQSQVRTIYRPQPGTVVMAVNDAPVTNFTENDETGVVTFTIPYSKTFTDALSKDGNGTSLITGEAGDFNGFKPYVGQNCLLTGWAQGANNNDILHPAAINGVSTDGSSMNVAYPGGYSTSFAESGVTGVSISVSPAPVANATITAGYKFFVPCRFDTDILPVTIEDYGVGGSNSVKLIEVRPSDPN